MSVCDSPCSGAAVMGRNRQELPGLQAALRSAALSPLPRTNPGDRRRAEGDLLPLGKARWSVDLGLWLQSWLRCFSQASSFPFHRSKGGNPFSASPN